MRPLVPAFVALWMMGCNLESPTNPDVVEAASPKERFVVAETARFAGILGARVRGEITDFLYVVPCPDGTAGVCHAFGWYHSGVAYYYRRDVNTQPDSTLSDAAAHEVCHSVSPFHDSVMYACYERIRNQ